MSVRYFLFNTPTNPHYGFHTLRAALKWFVRIMVYDQRRAGVVTVGRMEWAPIALFPMDAKFAEGTDAFRYLMQCGEVVGYVLRREIEVPRKKRKKKAKKARK